MTSGVGSSILWNRVMKEISGHYLFLSGNFSCLAKKFCAAIGIEKKQVDAQIVISEFYIHTVLIHDKVIAGHHGKERALTEARKS